jgi:hypothetical protein
MNLRKRFRLTVIQAQAILDMRLRRLAAMERRQLQDEAAELKKRIAYLKRLLKSGAMQIGVIKDEIREIKKKFAKPRRTVIVDAAPGERETILTTTDLEIPQAPQVVIFSPKGIGRRDAAGYSDRGRAGKSSRAADGGRSSVDRPDWGCTGRANRDDPSQGGLWRGDGYIYGGKETSCHRDLQRTRQTDGCSNRSGISIRWLLGPSHWARQRGQGGICCPGGQRRQTAPLHPSSRTLHSDE